MFSDFAAALRQWQPFYQVVGESAATLTGLMFVATTVGARVITSSTVRVVRSLIGPTLITFITVFLLSSLMCVPYQTRIGLSCELGFVGVSGIGSFAILQKAIRKIHQRRRFRRFQWAHMANLPMASYLGILASSAGLWYRKAWALETLSICVLALVAIGVYNAWEATLQAMVVKPEEIQKLAGLREDAQGQPSQE